MKKLKASSLVEVIAAMSILAIVFGFVISIMSFLNDSGKSLKTMSIEAEIDQLIYKEGSLNEFKDKTVEFENFNIEIQFDRDVSMKKIIRGLFTAKTGTGKEVLKQEFMFLDKKYE